MGMVVFGLYNFDHHCVLHAACEISNVSQVSFPASFIMPKAEKAMTPMKAAKKAAEPSPAMKSMKAAKKAEGPAPAMKSMKAANNVAEPANYEFRLRI